MKGRWYLEYLQFDPWENEIGSALQKRRVALKATTEEAAATEATKTWHKLLAKGSFKGWDGQTYPRQPQVIFFYKSRLSVRPTEAKVN